MSSILTINARGGMGLTAARDYFQLIPSQFKAFIRSHHTLLVDELQQKNVSYGALSPALVPTSGNRHETALLFNVDLISSDWYGLDVHRHLIPTLDKKSTLSVLAGDIGLEPEAVRQLAVQAGMHPSDSTEWGRQYIYCVYLNNLSEGQRDKIHRAFSSWPAYLGYVPTTYSSIFRTTIGLMLPALYVKHGKSVILDHGGDEPWVSDLNELSFPFSENGYRVVSVNSTLFSPLLSYKIPSEVLPMFREDVNVSLNAISEHPMELHGFEVLLPEAKFGYLHDKKGELLKVANLDRHSREQLAAVIRSQITGGYVYRLQHNVDDSVQFNLLLEFPRVAATPVKLVVALKYIPESRSLSLVTMT